MKKLISFLMILFILTPIAFAVTRPPASTHWEPAGFGGQGTFPQLITDLEIPGTLYMVSDVSGAFKSTDYAENWSFINNGTTSIINTSIVQSKNNPDVMYYLGLKLMRSLDRSKTWKAVGDFSATRPEVHKSIAIGNTNTNIVFVGLDNGKILRSLNANSATPTYTEYTQPFPSATASLKKVSFLYLSPDDRYLFAGSYVSGMVRYDLTDDTSTTITLTGTNATRNWDYTTYLESDVEHLCVTAGWKIACTADNGGSWDYTAAMSSDSLYTVARVAVKRLANTEKRFLLHLRKVSTAYETVYCYLSNDSGGTWINVEYNITRNTSVNPIGIWSNFGNLGNIQSMSADPFDEDRWYISTDGTVFISTDGGNNWVEKIKGGQNQVLTDLAFSPTGVGIMTGMDAGVTRTTDNGDTWASVLPNTDVNAPQGFAVAGHYWQVEMIMDKPAWQAGNGIVLVTSTYWADSIPRVARSADNGQTFTVITSGLPSTVLNKKVGSSDRNAAAWGWGIPRGLTCTLTGSICYLTIDGYSDTENGGVFYSTDTGLTWHRTTQPPEWRFYKGVSIDPTDPTGNTVIVSEWWQQAGGTPKTYKSTDRGLTWTEVYDTYSGTFSLAYNSAGNIFRTGLKGFPHIDYSTNGDAGTWHDMHDFNDLQQVADGLLIDPDDKNTIYVGINDGTNTGPTTGSGGGGNSSGTQVINQSVFVTNNAQAFNQATWTDITGDLPCPAGVTALAINKTAGEKGYLFALLDGAGVYRKNLSDTLPTKVEGMTFGP